ncbi:hypothetical protein KUIN1_09790 [Pseudomonas sp. KUIN-1]|nr:hypothetical protein KUIN1_09790 [Pseudomonas sp. KUIN-1]
MRELALGFGFVDSGIGCGVDNNLRFNAANGIAQTIQIRKIARKLAISRRYAMAVKSDNFTYYSE